MNDNPIPARAVTGLLREILTALDGNGVIYPARAAHVVSALRPLLAWPSLDEQDLADVTAALNLNLAGLPDAVPDQADPAQGPFASRAEAEAAFAAFRDATVRGVSGPPGEQLVFTAHQHLTAALTDSIEGYGAHAGAYDKMLIARLASYLDPVDVRIVASWIDRAVAAAERSARPEDGQ